MRLEFANPREELKPEMFADVVLESAPRTALKVPDDAVLDSGTRKVVFVAKGEGVLEPREVKVGEQGGGAWEILSGLSEGEEIALGASFLVDSESRLALGPRRDEGRARRRRRVTKVTRRPPRAAAVRAGAGHAALRGRA